MNGNGLGHGAVGAAAAAVAPNGIGGMFAGGGGFGFAGGVALGASYEITAEGTFKKGGWEINRQGVKTPPKPFEEKGLDERPGSRELDSPRLAATMIYRYRHRPTDLSSLVFV
jgi:hypothetical protein